MNETINQNKPPLTQKQLLSKLARSEPLDGLEIGDVDFTEYCFKEHLNFCGAIFIGKAVFKKTQFLKGAQFNLVHFKGESGANFRGVIFQGKRSAEFVAAKFTGKRGADFKHAKFYSQMGTNFNGAEFSGKGCVSFESANFDSHVHFIGPIIPVYVNFTGAKFSGEVGVSFKNAKFLNRIQANFTKSLFSGKRANFSYSTFSESANFKDVEFHKDGLVDFQGAKFSSLAFFERAHFAKHDGSTFKKTRFFNGVSFYETEFSGNGDVIFESTYFVKKGSANFSYCRFSNTGLVSFLLAQFSSELGAHFSNAKFLNCSEVDFTKCKFAGGSRFLFDHNNFWWRDDDQTEECVDFSFATFPSKGKVIFEGTDFKKNGLFLFRNIKTNNPENARFEDVFLGNCCFYKTDIKNILFKNVTFLKIKDFGSREFLADELKYKRFTTKKEKQSFLIHIETLYRQFKKFFEDQSDYSRAGDFHYGEMEMRRKQLKWFQQILSLILPYKWFSGYGEKWENALIWFFSLWLVFSGLNFYFINLKSNKNQELPRNSIQCLNSWKDICKGIKFRDSFFFTLNALTLRTDSIVEIKNLWLARGVKNAQNLAGPTIIALMLLAIRRKFKR